MSLDDEEKAVLVEAYKVYLAQKRKREPSDIERALAKKLFPNQKRQMDLGVDLREDILQPIEDVGASLDRIRETVNTRLGLVLTLSNVLETQMANANEITLLLAEFTSQANKLSGILNGSEGLEALNNRLTELIALLTEQAQADVETRELEHGMLMKLNAYLDKVS